MDDSPGHPSPDVLVTSFIRRPDMPAEMQVGMRAPREEPWFEPPFSDSPDGPPMRLDFICDDPGWVEYMRPTAAGGGYLPGPGGWKYERCAVVARVLDGWLLRAEMVLDDNGAPVVSGIEMRPENGAAGLVGANVLRQLGFGAVTDSVSRWLADPMVKRWIGNEWARTVRRPGRSGADLRNYAVVAARYVRACRVDPKRPYPVMVEEARQRGEYETEVALRSTVRRARSKGVLTPASGPRAGGDLTELGKQLAREMGEEV